jgi:hypothetical protein
MVKVNGRLASNGLFGYLAFGLANVGGAKNGMHGAHIILALPGGNYPAVDGLDPALGATVGEYMIPVHAEQPYFRYWVDSASETSRDLETTSDDIESTECFTALPFKTTSIHSVNFNLTGKDELLWAHNQEDYYAGYHGPSRGRFAIDWATGVASLDGDQDANGEQSDTSAADSVLSPSLFLLLTVVAGLQLV